MPFSTKHAQPVELPQDRRALIENLSGRFSISGVRRQKRQQLSGRITFVIGRTLLHAAKRCIDLLVASALLSALLPLLAFLVWRAVLNGGGIAGAERLGRWGVPYRQLSFEFKSNLDRTVLKGLPVLINLLRGDISLIGPRPVTPQDISAQERSVWRRFNVRPGLLCLFWIRKRANIAYSSETDVDSEYIDSHSLAGDCAIGLRAILASFYGPAAAVTPDRISLLGIPIHNLTMDEAIGFMVERSGSQSAQVCFVNADCVNIAFRNREYRELLNNTHLVLGDGIGIKLAGSLLNTNIKQNVNGTDLFPRLCAELERRSLGIYLFGGRAGVAGDVAQWIKRHHPALRICGTRHGYFDVADEPEIVREIANSGAQVLLVALGAPGQDLWISRHLAQLGVPVSVGVGGLFDFYSGRIPRAPLWMREVGLEWIYRFIQEPGRMWKRYFVGNAVFLYRVLRERKNRKPEHSVKATGGCS